MVGKHKVHVKINYKKGLSISRRIDRFGLVWFDLVGLLVNCYFNCYLGGVKLGVKLGRCGGGLGGRFIWVLFMVKIRIGIELNCNWLNKSAFEIVFVVDFGDQVWVRLLKAIITNIIITLS